jgi:hypothetical protein
VFLQAIEGGRSAVSELYGHILRDPRHKVELLHYEEITERRFGGWTMGLVDLSSSMPPSCSSTPSAPSSTPMRSRARCRGLLEELMATASIIGRS